MTGIKKRLKTIEKALGDVTPNFKILVLSADTTKTPTEYRRGIDGEIITEVEAKALKAGKDVFVCEIIIDDSQLSDSTE